MAGSKLKRANPGEDPLYARLDDIRMPAYERLTARAHLARAEAISDLIVAAVRALKSLAKAVTARRLRRAVSRIG
jgi:hypothetical protein